MNGVSVINPYDYINYGKWEFSRVEFLVQTVTDVVFMSKQCIIRIFAWKKMDTRFQNTSVPSITPLNSKKNPRAFCFITGSVVSFF